MLFAYGHQSPDSHLLELSDKYPVFRDSVEECQTLFRLSMQSKVTFLLL